MVLLELYDMSGFIQYFDRVESSSVRLSAADHLSTFIRHTLSTFTYPISTCRTLAGKN